MNIKYFYWGSGIILFLMVLLIIGGLSNVEPSSSDFNKDDPDYSNIQNDSVLVEDKDNGTSIDDGGSKEEDPNDPGEEDIKDPVVKELETRTFYLGFTPFPPELSLEAIDDVYNFIGEHGDLIAHHFDGGIPWDEALAGELYSDNYYEETSRRINNTPSGHKVFVSITPLKFERDELASIWGDSENMALTAPWTGYEFNDINVKQAYLKYAQDTIETFNPDYLAIGIEVNILINKDYSKWDEYLDLNEYIYTSLKADYPDITIFSTVQYEYLRGEEADKQTNADKQVGAVQDLLKNSDILALSTYHFGYLNNLGRLY